MISDELLRARITDLIEYLRLLATGGEAQVAWLIEHKVPANELFEQLNDMWNIVQINLQGRRFVSRESIQLIDRLMMFLQELNDEGLATNVDVWSDTAVQTLPEWQEVRERATRALRSFGEPD